MKQKNESRQRTSNYGLKAVIDIGSTSIRMVIAQIHPDGSHQILDSLHQSVSIGRDTFSTGKIARATIEASVHVLRNFVSVLTEYQMDLKQDVRAVATSAVREARNREAFLDRVYIATRIPVEVIEGNEVNRLTFRAVLPYLRADEALTQARLVIAEVGGGSTDWLALEEGRVAFAHTYRMGAYRLRELLGGESHASCSEEALQSELSSMVRRMTEGFEGKKTQVMFLGGEIRFAAKRLLPEWDECTPIQLSVSRLSRFCSTVLEMSYSQIVTQFNMTYDDAQSLGVALKIYIQVAQRFSLKKIYVCGVTLRDGLVEEAVSGGMWTDEFVAQIGHSAREIGHHYSQDEPHADCVSELALKLYDLMADEHRLPARCRVILTVAALLHDVGGFISNASHHKHSEYIIQHSDIFGLSQADIRMAGMVARYHRRSLPSLNHSHYAQVSRGKRLIISQLSAILRVADALDRSHTQALRHAQFLVKSDQLIVRCRPGEYAAEKRGLKTKASWFEQVYGWSVVLRTNLK